MDTFDNMIADIEIKTDPGMKEVFSAYPKVIQAPMQTLRYLIIEAAGEIEGLKAVEETLKWGEPSYLTKYGSTVRIDWKAKTPDQYAVYFKCTSKLVPTFREIYPKTFAYEGNRAIVFTLDEKIPERELKHCIRVALTYHKVKYLPMLGM